MLGSAFGMAAAGGGGGSFSATTTHCSRLPASSMPFMACSAACASSGITKTMCAMPKLGSWMDAISPKGEKTSRTSSAVKL